MIIKGYINTRAVLLVLSFFYFLLFATVVLGQSKHLRNGASFRHKGNIIEISRFNLIKSKTIDLNAGDTGILAYYNHSPQVVKVNGEHVYNINDLDSHNSRLSKLQLKSFGDYVLEKMLDAKDIIRLCMAAYHVQVNNVVVDKMGKIVFYNFNWSDIYKYDNNNPIILTATERKRVYREIKKILNTITVMPEKVDGANVYFLTVVSHDFSINDYDNK